MSGASQTRPQTYSQSRDLRAHRGGIHLHGGYSRPDAIYSVRFGNTPRDIAPTGPTLGLTAMKCMDLPRRTGTGLYGGGDVLTI